eukprot:Mrub_09440.p2 GENE.Mrub_09440~~Mrub_09440.p2  ORF type:complete len:208 (+),score=52.62 Mrub_09440:64-624(+)
MIKNLNERNEHQRNFMNYENLDLTDSASIETKLSQFNDENKVLEKENALINDHISIKKAKLEEYRYYHKEIIELLGDKSSLQNLNHRQIVERAVTLYKNYKLNNPDILNNEKDKKRDINDDKLEIVNKLKEEVDVLKELCQETQAKDHAIQKYLKNKDKKLNYLNLDYESEDTSGPSFMRALNIDF